MATHTGRAYCRGLFGAGYGYLCSHILSGMSLGLLEFLFFEKDFALLEEYRL